MYKIENLVLLITNQRKENQVYRRRTLREFVVFCDAILPN